MIAGWGAQRKGASAKTRRCVVLRDEMKARACMRRIVPFVPPPWRQSIRGSVSGSVVCCEDNILGGVAGGIGGILLGWSWYWY